MDPGAASGLGGSDAVKDYIDQCLKPSGLDKTITKDLNRVHDVTGIDGVSDSTLGSITVPLPATSYPNHFIMDVIGQQGSLCPMLYPNPAIRSDHGCMLSEFFNNGDGLYVAHAPDGTRH